MCRVCDGEETALEKFFRFREYDQYVQRLSEPQPQTIPSRTEVRDLPQESP